MAAEQADTHPNRQIVGFSLSPQLAKKVKAEAERRGVKLGVLFEQMWASYKQNSEEELIR